ncbi:hypothetical protein FACS189435_2790 [Bacteroidia bacterium]|nr:hypothetical protein FACS189435_2790 [Bacteroidia bacterium]
MTRAGAASAGKEVKPGHSNGSPNPSKLFLYGLATGLIAGLTLTITVFIKFKKQEIWHKTFYTV